MKIINGTKITCHGAKIHTIKIPKFTLNSGDLLCLHWPLPRFSQEERYFLDVLTGKRKVSAIEVYQPMRIAKEPFVKTYLGGLIYKKATVLDYLQKDCQLPIPEAQTVLNQLNLSPDAKVSALSLTHKTLLSIETSGLISRGIIFMTAGLDPQGMDGIYSAIAQKLQLGFFAIHFSYPTLPLRACYWKETCVECQVQEAHESG